MVIIYSNKCYSRLKEGGVDVMGLPAIIGLLIVIGSLVCIFYAVPEEK